MPFCGEIWTKLRIMGKSSNKTSTAPINTLQKSASNKQMAKIYLKSFKRSAIDAKATEF